MIKPFQHWYCDVCGEIIEDPAKGYVIWKSDGDGRATQFTVIHQKKCDDKTFHSSAALNDFLGDQGLARLTAFLSYGPIISDRTEARSKGVENIDEFIDFFRRMQIPYYEEARQKFGEPEVQERLSDYNEIAPYFPSTLREVIEM